MGAKKISHERRVFLLTVLAALPGSVVALVLLWTGDFTPKVQWTLTALIVGGWLLFANALRDRVVLPLQTVSNLLAAIRDQHASHNRGQTTFFRKPGTDLMFPFLS